MMSKIKLIATIVFVPLIIPVAALALMTVVSFFLLKEMIFGDKK